MNGYEEKVIPVNFKINGWYFGNLIIGGLLGMLIIDPATGAMSRIETPDIYETLSRASMTDTNTWSLQILDVKDVPEHLKPL